MYALRLNSKKNISVVDVPVPKIKYDEVLIKVVTCGICATDVDMCLGKPGTGRQYLPVIIGHEFAGIVEAVGRDVSKFKIGDRVSVDPNMNCGKCMYCKNNAPQFCKKRVMYGFNENGGMAEYCAVKQTQVYKLADCISFQAATFAEPLGCCIHALERLYIDKPKQIVIIGGGTIGTLLLQLVLKKESVQKVLLIEENDKKRKRALELGATLAISPTTNKLSKYLEKYGFNWIDAVFDCVSSRQTISLSCQLVRRGGQILLLGIPETKQNSCFSPFDIFRQELIITSSCLNPNCHEKALLYLKNESVKTDVLYNKLFSLQDAAVVIQGYDPSYYKQIVMFE